MSQTKRTQDEQFLIQLYRLAMGEGDPHAEVELAQVARTLKMGETATRTIVRDLAQANFIQKWGTTLSLTRRGADVAMDLL